MRRYFKDLSLLLVYFPYRWLVQTLPFQISYQIANLLGNIQYLFLPSRRKRQFATNLDLVFDKRLDSREKKAIMRRFYINRQKEFVDLFILGRKDYEKYLQACSVEGFNYVDEILSRGKGLVGLNFHFGSFNLIPPHAIYNGYKITPLLALSPYIKGASPWISEKVLAIKHAIWKERGNFQIITSSKSLVSLVKSQYRYLKENQIISAAGDGPLGKKFTLVDFFNVKLKAPLGPVLMSAKKWRRSDSKLCNPARRQHTTFRF